MEIEKYNEIGTIRPAGGQNLSLQSWNGGLFLHSNT
jgi:hypothetical protein